MSATAMVMGASCSQTRELEAPVTIAPTRDAAYIDAVLRHPEVYGPAHDDATPPAEALTAAPLVNRAGYVFLRVKEHGHSCPCLKTTGRNARAPLARDLGLFMLEPRGRGHIVHTCLLPCCRGALAVAAGKAGAAWMFTHTRTAALVSHCWENRPHVLWFAKRVGFEPRTFAPWPARVGGQTIFSTGVCLTRERWGSLQS